MIRRLLAILALVFALPLAAQDAVPPAPYANVQLADPAQALPQDQADADAALPQVPKPVDRRFRCADGR
jgi:hypothetical protein